MKINVMRDKSGRITSFDAISESSDGHLSDSEIKLLNDLFNKEAEEKTKEIIGKHKEWAKAAEAAFKDMCDSIVDYLDERYIAEAGKPKQPEFDHSVDHIDFSKSALPQNEEKPKDQKNEIPKPNPEKDAYYAQNGHKFS